MARSSRAFTNRRPSDAAQEKATHQNTAPQEEAHEERDGASETIVGARRDAGAQSKPEGHGKRVRQGEEAAGEEVAARGWSCSRSQPSA